LGTQHGLARRGGLVAWWWLGDTARFSTRAEYTSATLLVAVPHPSGLSPRMGVPFNLQLPWGNVLTAPCTPTGFRQRCFLHDATLTGLGLSEFSDPGCAAVPRTWAISLNACGVNTGQADAWCNSLASWHGLAMDRA